jgi:hypothetical protein
VVVRDDVAGLVDHEAGAERLLRRDPGQVERCQARRVLDGGVRRGDLDDAGRSAPVDLAHAEPAAVSRDLGGGGGDRGSPHHGGRAAAQVAGERHPAQRNEAAKEGGGGQCCDAGEIRASVHALVVATRS